LMAISAITLEEAQFGLAWQPNTRKLALLDALVERLHAVYPINTVHCPACWRLAWATPGPGHQPQRPRQADCRHCH
jgi:hypothetical protein